MTPLKSSSRFESSKPAAFPKKSGNFRFDRPARRSAASMRGPVQYCQDHLPHVAPLPPPSRPGIPGPPGLRFPGLDWMVTW